MRDNRNHRDDRHAQKPLSKLRDWKVADGDPDIRGWVAVTADNTRLGRVDRLIADTDAKRVRYFSIRLDPDLAAFENHEVLLPIGIARLDQVTDKVWVEGITLADVLTLPNYDRGDVHPDFEDRLRRGLMAIGIPAEAADHDLHPQYADQHESRFFGPRRTRVKYTDDAAPISGTRADYPNDWKNRG